jgi:hypothetical protein
MEVHDMGVEVPIGFAQVRFSWTVSGDAEAMYSTIGVSPPALATATSIANDADTRWLTNVAAAAFTSNTYVVGSTYVSFNEGGPGPSIAEVGTPTPGTAVVSPPPNNVAALVAKTTGVGGRRNKGRMYLPPFFLQEADVTASGAITNTVITALNTRLNNFRTAMEGLGYILVLFHSDGGVPTPITSLSLDARVATQRKRLRR